MSAAVGARADIARVALSLALTKETAIPVDDEEASRHFARVHITAVFGL